MSVRKSYTVEGVDAVSDIKCRDEVVIVQPIEEKERGGIIIPSQAAEKGQQGIVRRVGPGTKDIEMQVIAGDRVLHVKWAGSEVKVDGEKFLIMKQEDILGVYNGEREIDLAPIESRILIEWEQGREEYIGTKILRAEGSAKDRYYTGVVMAVGPEVEEVKVGERIFFNQFCGPERIDFDGKRYAMIYERDAYCVLPLRKDIVVLSH